MKYFSIEMLEEYHKYDQAYRTYCLYDVNTGVVFFKLEVDFNNKIPYFLQAIDEYKQIQDGLVDICLTLSFDDDHSFDEHILPLLRNVKLDSLLCY